MKCEELWRAMEAEAPTASAWLVRAAAPEAENRLLIALEQSTRIRALLLPASRADIPPRRDWPDCRGLELTSLSLPSGSFFAVRLRDPTCEDVFSILADDAAGRIAKATDLADSVRILLDLLHRWQLFLTAARTGLGTDAQRGLFGELHFLRSHLMPVLPRIVAVAGWKASEGSHQDFQFPSVAVELKTTSAKRPHAVRITSERQLDDTGAGILFLHTVEVDERELASSPQVGGLSLVDVVGEIRKELESDARSTLIFNERLLQAGWLDSAAARYESRRWAIRRERSYRIETGFPRIIEAMLPPGIGDVSYALDLEACGAFLIDTVEILAAIS